MVSYNVVFAGTGPLSELRTVTRGAIVSTIAIKGSPRFFVNTDTIPVTGLITAPVSRKKYPELSS